MNGLRQTLALLSLLVFAATAAAQTASEGEDPGAAVVAEAETVSDDEEKSADPADETMSDPADLVEEDPALEAKADDEFTPEDEISEDYPVPLPSDI
jgi:hypothetical protein